MRWTLKEELEFGQAGEIPLANGALQFSLLLSLRKVNTSWARQTRFIGKGVYREVVCGNMSRYRVCLSSRWMSESGKCSFIYLFIYFWLCWVFVSVRGFSLVVASGGHSSSRCTGLSLSRPLLLRSTGSRRAGSVIVAHGPSCSAACGILPDQGSNPRPRHWQADSQPLRHQGSSRVFFKFYNLRLSQPLKNFFP